MHGCETWSLTLNRQHELKVSGNMVLRKISEPKGKEVTWDCSKLHNFIIGIANIIGVIKSWTRVVGHVVWGIYRETISYRALVWKPEGKRPFGIPKHRSENKTFTLHTLPVTSSLIYQSTVNSTSFYLWVTQTTETTIHKTLGKSIVFYILISMFLCITRENTKNSEVISSRHSCM